MLSRSTHTITSRAFRTLRSVGIAASLPLLLALGSGCAADTEEGAASEGAISSGDLVDREVPGAELVLYGKSAGDHARELGILEWDVYSVDNKRFQDGKSFSGAVALGVDFTKARDVLYMVVYDDDTKTTSFIKVAKDGALSPIQKDDAMSLTTSLMKDMHRILPRPCSGGERLVGGLAAAAASFFVVGAGVLTFAAAGPEILAAVVGAFLTVPASLSLVAGENYFARGYQSITASWPIQQAKGTCIGE